MMPWYSAGRGPLSLRLSGQPTDLRSNSELGCPSSILTGAQESSPSLGRPWN